MPRVDLHVHTSASFDCRVPPREVAGRALRLGLGPIFITDHNTIEGALELLAAGFPVVVGEEISTSEGELIGLYMTQRVEPGLSAEATVDLIKGQGALVYVQHPFDRRRHCIQDVALERILDRVDIIEVFNARATEAMNDEARRLQEVSGAAAGAGSDAHRLADVGRCYVEIEPFSGPETLLKGLKTAKIVRQANPVALAAGKRLGGWLTRSR